MIRQKRRRFTSVILWLINTGLGLLHSTAPQREQPAMEQDDALTKLKPSVVAILQQALAQGHTCLSLDELVHFLRTRTKGIEEAEAIFALRQLSQSGDVSIRGNAVSLPHVAHAEEKISHRLRYIGQRLRNLKPHHLAGWIKAEAVQLTDEQREAVCFLAASPVAILTGDPGTGKTVTIKALTAVLERAGYQVYLTAPTGRAAARLAEATGRPAQTLHRLLHNNRRHQPLKDLIAPQMKEAIIVDEASMLDLFLAERLVEFCAARTKLILVGDAHQLPPVGPGQVFRDLLESGQVPVVELTDCLRQSEQSRITAAAKQIKLGITPELPAPGQTSSDCYFIEADNVFEIQRLVVNAATRSLPARCGADPYQDVQVLTPMRKGPLGTFALNGLIRRALNQESADANDAAQSSEQGFLPADRVLQTRNNYNLGVFNGECGIVEESTGENVTVKFGERRVVYHKTVLSDLAHGFAITIHRSQGSEYPFVIIPIHECQNVMLTRELLYTALTRGKEMVALIGSRCAFEQAINHTRSHRGAGLKNLLSPSTAHSTAKKAA
jgi:exodeoxyribonuclease V alpha subunit